MASSIGAPQQHKQPSRKGKKAWRKNVDITAVDSGLESLREEIIQGGPLAEKPSDELFALDTQGSKEIRRKHNLKKTLKMDEILARRSAVPALENGRTKKRDYDAAMRVTDGVVARKKQKPDDWVSKKELARLKNNLNAATHLDRENIDGEASNFDLWATTDGAGAVVTEAAPKEEKAQPKELEYVPRPRMKVPPRSLRQAPVALTASGHPVKAVGQPEAGTSYNPSFEDWDDLITREGEKEISAEKARLQEFQAAAERQARIDALAAKPDPSPGDDEESAWEGFETENDDDTVKASTLRKKRPERKTPAQRNRIKRRKESERLAKHEARMADRRKQAEEMIGALISQGDEEDNDDELALQRHDPSGAPTAYADENAPLRRRKMGPSAIPTAPLSLVLPDELQESLRRLRPEGNLLSDRFRTMLVNGKLEARKPVMHAPQRRKLKLTEKWAFKDFKLGV